MSESLQIYWTVVLGYSRYSESSPDSGWRIYSTRLEMRVEYWMSNFGIVRFSNYRMYRLCFQLNSSFS